MSYLPPGLVYLNSVISTRARISDAFGAFSIASSSVVVVAQAEVADMVETALDIQAKDIRDADLIKQAIALSAALLNTVDCSLAPNCSSLNRLGCTTVPNTCGPCISNSFTDLSGIPNTACTLNARRKTFILPDRDKTCPNNCSGLGVCVFVDLEWGEEVHTCSLQSNRCRAECRCRAGYSGDSCELTDATFSSKVASRELSLSLFMNLLKTEDPNEIVISNWANLLLSQTNISSEISATAKGAASKIVRSILQHSLSFRVSRDSIASVVNPMSILAAPNVSTGYKSDVSADTLDNLLEMYLSVLRNDHVLGEKPISISSDSFRSTIALSVADSINTVSLPKRPEDSVSSHTVSFPNASTVWSKDPVSISLSSISRRVYANASFLASPLKVSFDQNPLQSSRSHMDSVMILTFRTSSLPSNISISSSNESFAFSCARGLSELHQLNCSSGDVVSAYCNGSWVGFVRLRCPVFRSEVVCARLSGLSSDETKCSSILSETNITCVCPMPVLWGSPQSLSKGASVSYVPMIVSTAQDFTATWESADELNPSNIRDAMTMIWALLAIGSLGVGGVFWGMWADRISGEELKRAFVAQFNCAKNALLHVSTLNDLLNALPSLLSRPRGTFISRIIVEMKQKHPWLSPIFVYSKDDSRAMRMLPLISHILVFAFVNAAIYNTTFPDTSQCSKYSDERRCTEQDSTMTHESECYWDQSSSRCVYREPADHDGSVLVYILVVTSLISAPLTAMLMKTMEICTAPTDNVGAVKPQPESVHRSSIRARSTIVPDAEPSLNQEVNNLRRELSGYRSALPDYEVAAFDLIWGKQQDTDEAAVPTLLEQLFFGRKASAPAMLMEDVNECRATANREITRLRALKLSADEVSVELARLFVKDLLFSRTTGVLLTLEDNRNYGLKRRSSASLGLKIVSGVLGFALILSMCLYLLLFAVGQTRARQRIFVQLLVVSVLFDIIIMSTLTVYVMDIFMPSIAKRDGTNVIGDLKSLFDESQLLSEVEEAQGFSSSKYLFVSHRVATALKSSKVADIIISFRSVRPKRPYGNTTTILKSVVTYLLFYVLLNLPPQYQNSLVKFLLTIILGSMASAATSYGIFAVGLLCLLVLVAVHFLIYFYHTLDCCRHPPNEIHHKGIMPVSDTKGESGSQTNRQKHSKVFAENIRTFHDSSSRNLKSLAPIDSNVESSMDLVTSTTEKGPSSKQLSRFVSLSDEEEGSDSHRPAERPPASLNSWTAAPKEGGLENGISASSKPASVAARSFGNLSLELFYEISSDEEDS
jgi:hypothetical protein